MTGDGVEFTSAPQTGMSVPLLPHRQGCLCYLCSTDRNVCATSAPQTGMSVLLRRLLVVGSSGALFVVNRAE